jgi:hypothetical protein
VIGLRYDAPAVSEDWYITYAMLLVLVVAFSGIVLALRSVPRGRGPSPPDFERNRQVRRDPSEGGEIEVG